MNRKRRYTPKEKMEILRERLMEGVTAKEICGKYKISPSTFFEWKNGLFSLGDSLFKKERLRGAKKGAWPPSASREH